MELQLRLALPTMLDHNTSSDQSDASTGFHGSPISTHRSNNLSSNSNKHFTGEEFPDQSDSASTNQKDEDEDCPISGSLNLIRNGDDEIEEVMEWLPVKYNRKRQCAGAGGLFVKAQIEGVVITRKIDLSLHECYQTLLSTLLFMFGRGQESTQVYRLTYQDRDGDWLLADDVPWRTFVKSVHRIKLLKKEG